jgi:hypothetical protein
MKTTRLVALAVVIECAASPVFAGPCKSSIDELQRRVDAAIEHQAAAEPWRPESLGALRSHQPTPESIAAGEGAVGKKYRGVLVLLKRARAAERTGNQDRCNVELQKAWSAFDAI